MFYPLDRVIGLFSVMYKMFSILFISIFKLCFVSSLAVEFLDHSFIIFSWIMVYCWYLAPWFWVLDSYYTVCSQWGRNF